MTVLSEPKYYGDILDMSQTERDLWDDNEELLEINESVDADNQKYEDKLEEAEGRIEQLEDVLGYAADTMKEWERMTAKEIRLAMKALIEDVESAL